MDALVFYIPMIAFGATALLTGGAINVKDPRLGRRPGGFWSPVRLFNNAEWTAEGLIARRRFFRSIAAATGVALLSWLLVLTIVGR